MLYNTTTYYILQAYNSPGPTPARHLVEDRPSSGPGNLPEHTDRIERP